MHAPLLTTDMHLCTSLLSLSRVRCACFRYVLHTDAGEGTRYELIGVSNHFGSTGGGHYTAFARAESGQWHKFDDSHTAAVEPKDVVTPAAYVLMYVRKGDAGGAGAAAEQRASPEL